MEWVLCANTKHPILKKPTREELLKHPFVHPTYWSSEGLAKGNDFFEIPLSKRIMGYETSTADAALPLIVSTNQLGCMPKIIVQKWADRGLVKILKVPGIRNTFRDLYISVKSDSLSASLFERLKESTRAKLE
jgi:DNA-binding transcriptional LysR family regulator